MFLNMKLFEIENNDSFNSGESMVDFIEENFDIFENEKQIDKIEINPEYVHYTMAIQPGDREFTIRLKENKKLKKMPFYIRFHEIILENCGLESIKNINGLFLYASGNHNLPTFLDTRNNVITTLDLSNTNIQKFNGGILYQLFLNNCVNLESIDTSGKITILEITGCPMLKNFDFSKIDGKITNRIVFDEFLFKENQSLQTSVLMKTIPINENYLKNFSPSLKEFLEKIIRTNKSVLQKNIIKNLNELFSILD